jgi:hypothetical protein
MTELFNAKEARRLACDNDPDTLLKKILQEIKAKALEGKFEYITRSYGFGDSILYDMEINYPYKIKYILKSLRDLGFYATIKTDERQFVDIFLYVAWPLEELS